MFQMQVSGEQPCRLSDCTCYRLSGAQTSIFRVNLLRQWFYRILFLLCLMCQLAHLISKRSIISKFKCWWKDTVVWYFEFIDVNTSDEQTVYYFQYLVTVSDAWLCTSPMARHCYWKIHTLYESPNFVLTFTVSLHYSVVFMWRDPYVLKLSDYITTDK